MDQAEPQLLHFLLRRGPDPRLAAGLCNCSPLISCKQRVCDVKKMAGIKGLRCRHGEPAFLFLLCGSVYEWKRWAPDRETHPARQRLSKFRTFFAVRRKRGRRHRQGRKWIAVPISSRAPVSDPRRISNTMFYKLMFLEVGQGYPQRWRETRLTRQPKKCAERARRGPF